MKMRKSFAALAGAASFTPLAIAPSAALADNGVCESMDEGGPWIEICMDVRGAENAIRFTVHTDDDEPGGGMSGYLELFTIQKGDKAGQIAFSPTRKMSLSSWPGRRSITGCGGDVLGNVFTFGADPCQPWPNDGEMYFVARRFVPAGAHPAYGFKMVDSLESSHIGIDGIVK